MGYEQNGVVVPRLPFPEEPENFQWRAGKEEKSRARTTLGGSTTLPPPSDPSRTDMVAFTVPTGEQAPEKVQPAASPPNSTTKRKHQWIMIPSSGNDVTLDKYRRMPQPTFTPDVTTDAPTSSTSTAPKRTALPDSEDKGSQKKTRHEQGVSLEGQTRASSSSSSFQSSAVTREVRSTF